MTDLDAAVGRLARHLYDREHAGDEYASRTWDMPQHVNQDRYRREAREMLAAASWPPTVPAPTATPPRADLRTLAAEPFWAVALPALSANADPRLLDLLAHALEAGVAAVLPEHRRMVLTEAAEAIELAEGRRCPECRGKPASLKWNRSYEREGRCGCGHRWTVRRGDWTDPVALIRRLAAAAPPDGLSATVPAENAPAVPEEADGQRAGEGVDLDAIRVRADTASSDWRWAATYQDHGLRAAKQLVRDDLLALLDLIDRLAAQVERVRAIHQFGGTAPLAAHDECRECLSPWPCPTIAAVDAPASNHA